MAREAIILSHGAGGPGEHVVGEAFILSRGPGGPGEHGVREANTLSYGPGGPGEHGMGEAITLSGGPAAGRTFQRCYGLLRHRRNPQLTVMDGTQPQPTATDCALSTSSWFERTIWCRPA
jgi:hypothetical protein